MRSKTKQRGVMHALLPAVIGAILYVLLGLLLAQLIGSGTVPEPLSPVLMYAALLTASVLAGAISGGGRRGLFTGALLMLCYLILKLILEPGDFFSVSTLIGVICTLPGAWFGSCIFHKKRTGYTNRNRRNRHGNYK